MDTRTKRISRSALTGFAAGFATLLIAGVVLDWGLRTGNVVAVWAAVLMPLLLVLIPLTIMRWRSTDLVRHAARVEARWAVEREQERPGPGHG